MNTKYVVAQFKYGIVQQLYADGLLTTRQMEKLIRLIKIDVEAGDYDEKDKSSVLLPCFDG